MRFVLSFLITGIMCAAIAESEDFTLPEPRSLTANGVGLKGELAKIQEAAGRLAQSWEMRANLEPNIAFACLRSIRFPLALPGAALAIHPSKDSPNLYILSKLYLSESERTGIGPVMPGSIFAGDRDYMGVDRTGFFVLRADGLFFAPVAPEADARLCYKIGEIECVSTQEGLLDRAMPLRKASEYGYKLADIQLEAVSKNDPRPAGLVHGLISKGLRSIQRGGVRQMSEEGFNPEEIRASWEEVQDSCSPGF